MNDHSFQQVNDHRADDAKRIKQAYEDVGIALATVGKLLRTTDAGRFMWSAEHKTAVSGLKVIVDTLKKQLPRY